MTLKEVPTEILKESLLALADLRRKYKGEKQQYHIEGRHGYLDCPLCRMVCDLNPDARLMDGVGCAPCPWGFVEGRVPDGDTWDGYLCKQQGKDYDDDPIPARFSRIDRWEAAINAELATR